MRSTALACVGVCLWSMVACAGSGTPPEPVAAQPAATTPTSEQPKAVDVAKTEVALQWNWNAGQRATYRLKSEQKAENAVEAIKQRSEGGTEWLATFEGAAPDEKGVFPVRFAFGELFTHEFNLGVTKDSRSTPILEGQLDSMRNAALRGLVGEGGTALFEPTGMVSNVLGMQGAYQGARARIRNLDTQAWVDQMFKFFNPDAMRLNLSTAMGCVPGADVRVGDTWASTSTRDSAAGFLAFERTWKLDRVEQKDGRAYATISGTTKVTLPENTGLLSSFYSTTVIRGDGSAVVVFDVDRGIIESARMETVLEFENQPHAGRDPVKYKPYKQSLVDVMTLTLEGFGDGAKTFEKIAEPDVKGPMEKDAG